MNWDGLKQIVNMTRLRLYNSPERPKEEIFPEDDFDIS
jgi:hypothetical protein